MKQREVIELLRGKKYDKIIELLIKEQPSGPQVTSPWGVYQQLLPYTVKKQENFLVLTLDGSHQTINVHEVTKGIANRTLVHPREVFAPAIEDRAVAIIIAHNHPSGKTDPSGEDLDITRRLVDAGEILGIPVLDHVIVGRESYTSLKDGYSGLFDGVKE
jgi:DNA repair protein RadC